MVTIVSYFDRNSKLSFHWSSSYGSILLVIWFKMLIIERLLGILFMFLSHTRNNKTLMRSLFKRPHDIRQSHWLLSATILVDLMCACQDRTLVVAVISGRWSSKEQYCWLYCTACHRQLTYTCYKKIMSWKFKPWKKNAIKLWAALAQLQHFDGPQMAETVMFWPLCKTLSLHQTWVHTYLVSFQKWLNFGTVDNWKTSHVIHFQIGLYFD